MIYVRMMDGMGKLCRGGERQNDLRQNDGWDGRIRLVGMAGITLKGLRFCIEHFAY